MIYIILGVCSFLVAYWFDFVSFKKIPLAKLILGGAAGFLGIYSLFMVCFRAERFVLPGYLSFLGWFLLFTSSFLLFFSLFWEIPLRKTYLVKGVGDKLIKTGTYALVRHPGVIWYTLFLLALLLISRSRLLLIAFPIWVFMDVLYILIQEKFYFPHMFPGYGEYKKETPMLIPNRKSFSSFLASFGKRGS